MTDHANGHRSGTESDSAAESEPERTDPDGVETVEAYETDEGVVLYDAENPLAWVQSSSAVVIEDQA